MLPSFVIGLREGLEAALIVGIIAAFLVTRGRGLRPMWLGVALAIALCASLAVIFTVVGSQLSFKARETAEGVLSLVAVAGVTYMIVWMRRHSRELKGQLETRAALALTAGSGLALAAMAFFAVLREGLETAVFLLAAFQQTAEPLVAGLGALIGVLVAVGLGYGIYRGGVRIDMARFFKVTGIVLVFVAAGLLASAVHEFAEAGVLTAGQGAAIDLSWLVSPGSVQASLITGMFGLQPVPTVAEVLVWLAYVVPMTIYILKPIPRAETAGTRTVSTAA
jgi:high-affinity iron transporter